MFGSPFCQFDTQVERRDTYSVRGGCEATLIHPRNDRVEVAAANHVPFAADVQAADESNQPGFKASFDDRISFFWLVQAVQFESPRR
jgi:hypothetical protein